MSRGMEKTSRTQKRAKIFPPAQAGGIFYGKVRVKRRCPRCSAGEEGTCRSAIAPLRMEKAPKFVIARLRRSRGNLAAAGQIGGKPSAKSQLPPRDSHVASLLGMTNLKAFHFPLSIFDFPFPACRSPYKRHTKIFCTKCSKAVHKNNPPEPRRDILESADQPSSL